MNEIEVEVVQVNGNQYKCVKTDEGEFWCLRTIAQHTEVPYKTITYHLKTKSGIFTPLIYLFSINEKKSRGRPNLFLKVPDGLDQLRLYVRKLKTNPEMNKIMSFISRMRKGEVVAAKKEDVDKLKASYAKTQHLVLGQDMSYVIDRLERIETLLKERLGPLALVDKELMDPDRVAIVNWLLETLCEETQLPFKKVWWEFSKALGNIQGYSKQPKSLFPDMINFFYTKSRRLVARVLTWYNSQSEPQQEIKRILVDFIEGNTQKKLDDSKDYM